MRTLYEVLEVSETASQETIAAAYQSLSKRYHPDANLGTPSAWERFKEINQAFDILGDPLRRRHYDSSTPNGRVAGSQSPASGEAGLDTSRRRPTKLHIFGGIAAFVWLLILVTDTRVLIWQAKVNPGDSYYYEGYGQDLGKSKKASLVGYYFNGRGIVSRVYWYSPNNIFGRDSCPFLLWRD